MSGAALSRSRAEAAFTLIEVMVAVALLAVALTPLLVTFGGFLAAFGRSKGKTYETLGAVSGLAEVEAVGLPEAQGDYAGEVEGNSRMRWQVQVAADEPALLAELKARSGEEAGFGADGSKGGSLELATWIVDPIYPPPEEK